MFRSTLFRMLTLVGNNLVSPLAQHPLLASEPRVPRGEMVLSGCGASWNQPRTPHGVAVEKALVEVSEYLPCPQYVPGQWSAKRGSGPAAATWPGKWVRCKFSDLLRHSGGAPLPSQARPRHTAVCRGLMAAKQAARHRSTSTRVCLTLKFVLLTLSFKF